MGYTLRKVTAGISTVKAFFKKTDSIHVSPNPTKTVHLLLDFEEDGVNRTHMLKCLIPPVTVEDFDRRIEYRTIDDLDVDGFKTLKELEKWFDDVIGLVGSQATEEETNMFVIDLFEHLQKAYIRIAKNVTAKSLNTFTDKCFKRLTDKHDVVIYVHEGKAERPVDADVQAGWAFLTYLENLTSEDK